MVNFELTRQDLLVYLKPTQCGSEQYWIHRLQPQSWASKRLAGLEIVLETIFQTFKLPEQ